MPPISVGIKMLRELKIVLPFLIGLTACVSKDTIDTRRERKAPDPLPPTTPQERLPPMQSVGVWITHTDSEVMTTQASMEQTMQILDDFHITTVYPNVFAQGKTYYPSQIAAETLGSRSHPDFVTFDRVKTWLKLGKKHQITIVPWFEYGLMFPKNSQLFKDHPEWFAQTKDGGFASAKSLDSQVWLSPAHPQARRWFKNLMVEFVQTYDVDMIQLDDHFALPNDLGWEAPMSAQYEKAYGEKPDQDPKEAQWVQFRADQLGSLLLETRQAMRNVRPELKVHLAPNPVPWAKENYLQDWPKWVKSGAVDELTIQVYRYDEGRFEESLEDPILQAHRERLPTSVALIAGLRSKPVPLQQILQQSQLVHQENFHGISFFFYESLWKFIPETESTDQRWETLRSLMQSLSPQAPQ